LRPEAKIAKLVCGMATLPAITMTAKELKNRTGEALRAVSAGRRVVLTRHGKPVAVMVPADPPAEGSDVPSYEETWTEIEAALAGSTPAAPSWRTALDRSRRRG
jgi:prevent-host-death family protein